MASSREQLIKRARIILNEQGYVEADQFLREFNFNEKERRTILGNAPAYEGLKNIAFPNDKSYEEPITRESLDYDTRKARLVERAKGWLTGKVTTKVPKPFLNKRCHICGEDLEREEKRNGRIYGYCKNNHVTVFREYTPSSMGYPLPPTLKPYTPRCPYDDTILRFKRDEGGYPFYSCPKCRREFELRDGVLSEEKSALMGILRIFGKSAKDTYGTFKDMKDKYWCPKCMKRVGAVPTPDNAGLMCPYCYTIFGKRYERPKSLFGRIRGMFGAGAEGLKKHRTTLLTELPKLLVILIGMSLFTIELMTFGGGEFGGMYFYFILGGIAVAVVSWYLDVMDRQKQQKKEGTKNDIQNSKDGVEGKKESKNSAPGGIWGHAALAGEIEGDGG